MLLEVEIFDVEGFIVLVDKAAELDGRTLTAPGCKTEDIVKGN
jgi:hypothetical protein